MILWNAILLTADEIARNAVHEIQDEFYLIFVQAGSPKEAKLYLREIALPGEFSIYLTPGAGRIVGNFLAGHELAHCAPPDTSELAVLVQSE